MSLIRNILILILSQLIELSGYLVEKKKFTDLLPSYIGCSGQNPNNTEIGDFLTYIEFWATDPSPTAESCAVICRENKFTFCGVQYSKCYCAKKLTTSNLVVNDTSCEGSCSQQFSKEKPKSKKMSYIVEDLGRKAKILAQACGTPTHMAIYSVCALQFYSSKCDQECNCRKGACDVETGRCQTKGCDVGWTGPKCNYPDPCSRKPCQNNGRCFDPIDKSHKYTCSCVYGYHGENCENGYIDKGSNESSSEVGEIKAAETKVPVLDLSPSYLGCYNEVLEDADFDESYLLVEEKMTLDECAGHCKEKKMTYMALMGGKNCKCNLSYGKHGETNTSFCSFDCPGNSKEKCGGVLSMSVYTACPIGHYMAPSCNYSCHCDKNTPCPIDTGLCPNATCTEGYTGPTCSKSIEKSRSKNRVIARGVSTLVIIYTIYFLIVFVLAWFGPIFLATDQILPTEELTPVNTKP